MRTPITNFKTQGFKSTVPSMLSKPITKDKVKTSFSSAYTGDDGINDVAAIGGVNLAEETQRILGSTEFVGTQIRWCKHEFLLGMGGPLQHSIRSAMAKWGIEEPTNEVAAVISHAVQERLQNLVEKLAIITEHRLEMVKSDQRYEVTSDIIAPKNKFKPFDEAAQAEEEHLSNILFGGPSSFLKSLEEAEQETFSGPSALTPDSGVGDDSDDTSDDRKPAWMDEDDDGIEVGPALDAQGRRLPRGGVNDRSNQYSYVLKHKFEMVIGTPRWAALKNDKDCSSDSDDEILRSCGFITKTARKNLPGQTVEFKKVKDLNSETYSEGIINCIEFHPKSSAALVGGSNGIASLFAVDGKRNSKLHSVAFERFPIMCAQFADDGNEAILGSRQSHIYSYDLLAAKTIRVVLPHGLTQCKNFVLSPDSKYMAVAGKWGEVHVLLSRSKERIGLLKQDSDVTALAFSPSGGLLYGHSVSGEVTMWDMNMGRVRHKWIDEGCIQGSSLAVSSSNQFVAAGSMQGVVNLYGVEDVLHSKLPKPRKTIFNLTTAITDLRFNPSSEAVAFGSADIENSVRLFHVGSGSVFSNFPPFGTKLGHVTAVNFSPGSGFIAFGNKKATVALYRLKHFKNY